MKEEKIKVLALLPMELPKEIELDNTLEAIVEVKSVHQVFFGFCGQRGQKYRIRGSPKESSANAASCNRERSNPEWSNRRIRFYTG